MSTKLRVVLCISGSAARGKQVPELLVKYLLSHMIPIPLRGEGEEAWKYWIKLYNLVPVNHKSLWIFREPRGIKKRVSRYKIICGYFGIGWSAPRENAELGEFLRGRPRPAPFIPIPAHEQPPPRNDQVQAQEAQLGGGWIREAVGEQEGFFADAEYNPAR